MLFPQASRLIQCQHRLRDSDHVSTMHLAIGHLRLQCRLRMCRMTAHLNANTAYGVSTTCWFITSFELRKTEAKIASLLDACPTDKAKLIELLEQCMSESVNASNTDSEGELEEKTQWTTTIMSSLTWQSPTVMLRSSMPHLRVILSCLYVCSILLIFNSEMTVLHFCYDLLLIVVLVLWPLFCFAIYRHLWSCDF